MKRISLVVVAVCCAFACALVGCSNGGSGSGQPASSDGSSSGQQASASELQGFWVLEDESLGFTGMVNLDEEDLAELLIADTYLEGTWKAEGSKGTITFEDLTDSKPVNVSLNGDKLIYGSEQGSHLVFVKSDPDEFYDDLGEIDEEVVGSEEAELLGLSDGIEIVDEVIEDITPVKVADDSIIKIEVTGKGTDFVADPGYRLSITNKSDKTIFLGAEGDFKVDGKAAEAALGDVLEPGDTIETFMYFSTDELGGGVEKLKNVEGKIAVIDDETEKQVGSYAFKMD